MVQFQNNVLNFFDDLIYALFENEYFGYVESSKEYVNKIVDFIYSNIDTFPPKTTPAELQKFGSTSIFYKINPRTTWYIFFEKQKNSYLVSKIINNHCKEAKWL
jgi:hypothetical protein